MEDEKSLRETSDGDLKSRKKKPAERRVCYIDCIPISDFYTLLAKVF